MMSINQINEMKQRAYAVHNGPWLCASDIATLFAEVDDLTESNRQLREELEKVKAAEHPWAKALSKKWLDPECSDGCQSLKHKHRIERQDRALAAAKEALQRIATHFPIDDGEEVKSLARHKCEQARNALARIAECEKGTARSPSSLSHENLNNENFGGPI
jgi:hypothetical protein